MFQSYLKTAFRNIKRQKLYALINIFGLALGMAVCLLAYLYINDELTYDQWYPDSERIYRLTGKFVDDGDVEEIAVTPWPLGKTLARELPEVEATALVNGAWREVLFVNGDKEFYVKSFANVDTTFFDVFQREALYGNLETAFDQKDNIVLSEKLATQFFGSAQAAYGQTIELAGSTTKRPYKIAAILKDPPGSSHFNYDAYKPHWKTDFESREWVSMFNYHTYVKLQPNVDLDHFMDKSREVLNKHLAVILESNGGAEAGAGSAMEQMGVDIGIQPISSIHLDSHLDGEIEINGDRRYLYVYGLIALVIMIIAVINFMNIATARSAQRAKEVGVRKVIGASRFHSSGQFLTEAIVQSVCSLVFAILLAELMLPFFNGVLEKDLVVFSEHFPQLLGISVAFSILIGLLAGSYPAFFLSGFKPIRVLKGDFSRGKESVGLRKGLVIVQFTACAALILFLITVVRQINYMHEKELGFQAEQVMVVPIQGRSLNENFKPLKTTLLQNPNIQSVSQSLRMPGEQMGGNEYQAGNGKSDLVDFNRVDEDFIDALNIQLKEGRFFRNEDFNDTLNYYVVNEKFVQHFNLGDDPVGQNLYWSEGEVAGQIIGVTENFHWKGFTENIQPHVLQEKVTWSGKAAIRVSPNNLPATIKFIETEWRKHEPNMPMKYTFLDEDFAQLYKEYTNFGKSLSYLTFLIIFTAVLGLFGLASYMAEQRTKEIGIRKVLGASVQQILYLLVKDFAKLVLISGIAAIPIGFYLSNNWLQEFAYRTTTAVWIFPAAVFAILFIAIMTVGMQAYKASTTNPVEAIQYE